MKSDFLDLAESPLAGSVSPVRIAYAEHGEGTPIIVLHGGWGFRAYPFDRQMALLGMRHRVVLVDRSGYGGSGDIADLPVDFHRRAAVETLSVLTALSLERVVLWGHSDGAVIAALLAIAVPGTIQAIVLEAGHLYGRKPRSRSFFETAAADPVRIVGRLAPILDAEHGGRWPDIVARHGRAWLGLAASDRWSSDLYEGGLRTLALPILVVHGERDPRTEPGELDAMRAALPDARFLLLEEGAHSPHSEELTADLVAREVSAFVDAQMMIGSNDDRK